MEDAVRFDETTNVIDIVIHCNRVTTYLAEDFHPGYTRGQEYADFCRRLILILNGRKTTLLGLVNELPEIFLKPNEQCVVLLAAASRLQEDVCRAQQLGTEEGHIQATNAREHVRTLLGKVLKMHLRMVEPEAVQRWRNMNLNIYEGPPCAPPPEVRFL